MDISSSQNLKIKEIIRLRKAAKRKKEDLIVIEGKKEIEMARAGGIEINNFFCCPELNQDADKIIPGDDQGLFSVAPGVFKKISLREHPDGFLATAKPRYFKLSDIKLSPAPLVLVLEAVEKPGNLGAIFRVADAAGVDAVIISDPRTDIYNPNVIRASRGAVFSVPAAISPADRIITWLKDNKIKIFAATPNTDKFYTEPEYSGAAAIVIGTEHEGLSETWLKAADQKIKIPMRGKIDSLNAAVSAAVMVYEVIRQRGLR